MSVALTQMPSLSADGANRRPRGMRC